MFFHLERAHRKLKNKAERARMRMSELEAENAELKARIDALESVGRPAHIYCKILEWMDGETGQSEVCSRPSFETFREHYERLKADAARYRFLRDNKYSIIYSEPNIHHKWRLASPKRYSIEYTDDPDIAIDNEMKRWPKRGAGE